MRRNGTTVLLATRLLDEAKTLCGRIGILDGGHIALEGDMDTLGRTVPARPLAEVDAEDDAALIETLDGIVLRSAALKPAALDHVFLEVVGAGTPGCPQVPPTS